MRRSANDLPEGKAFLHTFYFNLNLFSNLGVRHKNHEALNPGDAVSALPEAFNPNLVALAPLYRGLPGGKAFPLQLKHHRRVLKKRGDEEL